jgi:hypothetical protein
MRRAVLGVAAALLAARVSAATFTVLTTSDSGAGSLRQAMTDANAAPGPDAIVFNMPGIGVKTIVLASPLPALVETVTIDGYTQPGALANTLADGNDAVLLIEIDGTNATGDGCGIRLNASGSTVRGLVLNRFPFSAVCARVGGGHVITGNFIGTDAAGTAASPNADGVNLFSDSNRVGGTLPSERNLVSGNTVRGIVMAAGESNVVQGNFIGTDRHGTSALGNAAGILTFGPADRATIGGTDPGARNIISGNTVDGISFGTDSIEHVVLGNYIGTDVTGTQDLGNGFDGIFAVGGFHTIGGNTGGGNLISGNGSSGLALAGAGCLVQGNRIGTDVSGAEPLGNDVNGIFLFGDAADSLIGGTVGTAGNVIAFNGSRGIWINDLNPVVRNAIRRNSIYRNGAIGTDLGEDGPTPNDDGDGDTGENERQNFPLIRSAVSDGVTTTIQGAFRGAPNAVFTLEFFSNPCNFRPRALLQGQTYLGDAQITTDASGFAEVDVTLPVGIDAGAPVSATATDAVGNTSEFSQQIVFAIAPASGPAAGGTPVTITGTNFHPGVAVTIGGTAPVNLVRVSDVELTAESPALPPGSLNDVVVTNPDTTAGTLLKGWVADFQDVPDSHQFHDFVTRLVSNGVTVGCGGGLYCVSDPTTRGQMAVFLIKARLGFCFTPPPATGTVFADVPVSNIYAAWIEELERQGLTAGCGGGNYCPGASVTRAQMAVFLLNTAFGPGYVPPPATGTAFDDVPLGSFADEWIEDLVARGITAGCSAAPPLYCPLNPITRGQMAVFVTTTFNLQP